MQLDPVAKVLIVMGVFLIVVGVAWQFGWIQALKLGRLPGDIVIEDEHTRMYIPLTTMFILSVVMSVISWVVFKVFK